jgi:hypothetical protein
LRNSVTIDKHPATPYYGLRARHGRHEHDSQESEPQMVDERMHMKGGTMTIVNSARLRVPRAAAFGTPDVGVLGRGLPSGRFWELRQRH